MLKFWSLFSGVGLLDVGFAQAGIEHILFCESDPWRREIIAKRWPGVPICADIRELRAGDAEPPDGVVGGFPCRGISSAGRQEGFDHPETVLWREMARVVGELRPRYVVLENVANLLTLKKGLVWQEVLETLAALGLDVVWDCIPASALHAPHKRDRVFAVAIARHADRREHPQEHASYDGVERERKTVGRRPVESASPGGLAADDGGRDSGTHAGAGQPAAEDIGAAAHPARLREGRPGPQTGTDGERARPGADAAADAGGGPAQLRRGPGAVRGAAGAAEGEGDQRERGGDAAADRAEAAADADGREHPQEHAGYDGERGEWPAQRRRPEQLTGLGGHDTASGRRVSGALPVTGEAAARDCGVAVEWGVYQPAIIRWEQIHGPAPEPLIRRMDDGDPKLRRMRARLDRRRLSALGDGVQVYVARVVGEYVVWLDQQRRLQHKEREYV